MPILITITGPIAAGKNTVVDLIADHCLGTGRTVVIADVDDIADMVAAPGAGAAGVLIDAALSATWQRVIDDVHRRMSRQRDFHESAHARYQSLKDQIPADLIFDSAALSAADIAERIITAAGLGA